MNKVPGYREACKILKKHLTARAKALADLERYVDGTAYDHLPDWFSDKKPLWERAPCIVYPIVKSAIDSNGDLLLGEGRFPEARVDELEGDDTEDFEKAVETVIQQARLRAAAREVFAAGQGCGSACAVFGVRNNRLFIDTVAARTCIPVLDDDGAVESLEIRYPYLYVVKDQQGNEKVVCKLYRRTIDNTNDITYAPAIAREDGTEPKWVESKSVQHGFGFCPVVWFPHLRGCAVVDDYDGRAIHEHLTDEIRAHDFALSQRHRAAMYAGDPQWTEIGVDPGYNPTGAGRQANLPPSRALRPGETSVSSYVDAEELSGASKVRKKSPGTVWQYKGKVQEVAVELHCLPGDALQALDNHAKDLRSKLAESLGVVFTDPENLPNESRISGRALESFKARQLDRVDYYRSDFGDRFLLPALGMLLRIALQTGLKIPGIESVKKAVTQAGERWAWTAPPIQLIWGAYFKLTGEDEELTIRGCTEAIAAGVATKKIVVQKLRDILGIRDVDSYMIELEAERVEQVKHAGEMAKAVAPPAPPAKASAA